MPRSIWKGPFIVPFKSIKGQPIRTDCRAATILPSHIGQKFEIHNGKDYIPITITEDMVNHRLGEFAPTRQMKNLRVKQDMKAKAKKR